MPGRPWEPDEARGVFAAVRKLGTVPLAERDACPADGGGSPGDDILRLDDAGEPAVARTLDDWSSAHLDDLVALESGWSDAVRGDALVHLDVRSDNILHRADRARGARRLAARVHRRRGGCDLLVMIPSMVLEGAGEPEELAERSGLDAPAARDRRGRRRAGRHLHVGREPSGPTRTPHGPSLSSAPRARWPCGGCARGWATRYRSSVRGMSTTQLQRDVIGDIKVIDVDTHLTEPHDLWTHLAPRGWEERLPHVREVDGRPVWMCDGNIIGNAGRCGGDPARREEGRRHRVPRVPHRGRAPGGVRRRRARSR